MAAKHCPECGRLMISISWSGLRTHEECKQRSHLTRSKKLGLLENKRGFFAGTVTDRVVRRWLEGDPASNPGVMPDMVDAMIDSARQEMADNDEGVVRWKDPGDRERMAEECRRAVTLIEPDLMRYVVPYEYQADYSFKAPVKITNPKTGQPEEVVLRGYMDILVRTGPDQWWVWDVKHTTDNSYWRKTIGQLGFYSLAIQLLTGHPAVQTGLMQPLCDETIKPYRPSLQSQTELLQRIAAMARDIWLEDHTPVKGTGPCGWCPTKHACIKFAPVRDQKGGKRVPL